MRALSSLNLAANNLGELVLPEGWTEDWDDEDDLVYEHTDGRTQKEHPGKPDGIIAIANAIPNMGALSSLNLASNAILSKESGRALADALKTNSVLTELDVSDNQDKHGTLDGAGFAKELTVGIKDNGALSNLDLSMNRIPATEVGMLNATCKAKGVDLAL
jgi:hypothetical protein